MWTSAPSPGAATLLEGRLHGDLLAAAQDDRPHRLAGLDRVQHEHQVLDAGDVVLAEPDEDIAPAHASEVGGPAGADVCQQHAALAIRRSRVIGVSYLCLAQPADVPPGVR